CLDEDWRFVVSSVAAQTSWLHRKISINRRTFLIDNTSPYSLKRMAEYLQAGGRLVLFAEGRLSRTGSLMKLFDGTGFLLHKTRAKVITCYLRGVDRQRLTVHRNLKQWFPRVTAHFSEVLLPPKLENVTTSQARNALTNWLRDQMVSQQFVIEMQQGPRTVLAAAAETARFLPRFVVLEDATRQGLTFRRLMAGVDLMARQWRAMLGSDEYERIGVLLPNISATPTVLLSLWAAKKVPVVLFTSGSEGVPKGVELTQTNLIANIRQLLLVTDIQDNDRIFNAMPLFHSFGLTIGTLLPLVRGVYVFIYPSPLHYRAVPTIF